MVICNKLTREKLEITYPEFRKKFAKEQILRRVSVAKLEVAKTKANDNDSVMSDLFLWSNNPSQSAFESYRQTQLNKYSYNFKDDNSMEFNFYFELQWNLRLAGRVRSAFAKQNTQTRLTPANKRNHFGMSNWYIERMD